MFFKERFYDFYNLWDYIICSLDIPIIIYDSFLICIDTISKTIVVKL